MIARSVPTPCTGLSPINTSPASGTSSPARIRSSVVFPQPDGPTTARISPPRMSSRRLRRTFRRCPFSAKDLDRPRTATSPRRVVPTAFIIRPSVGRSIAGDEKDVLRHQLARFDLALALQHVDPELDVALDRQATGTHAVALEVLSQIGVFASLPQNAGEDGAGLLRVFARVVERLGRPFDESPGVLRVSRDPVAAEHHEAAGDLAQDVRVVEDRTKAAALPRNPFEGRLPIAEGRDV